ncbi:hypothetical protein D1155_15335 [Anaerotruncus sp. 80]|uniref:Uncharacterized protein n=1 Tax=Anaerotruncus colihominis TaxID=169435 RepID=A0A845QLA5_9FIRM|nr:MULTISPECIES: hypothetical protein [Anaerotruncus]NBH63012.1 hypothetical protein [Anaerotruncus colihominis]NCF03666.1 hypothetical protein [Anaerotruncus sp. 80]
MPNFEAKLEVKPTDDYDKAKKDVIKAIESIRKLNPREQEKLVEEIARMVGNIMFLNLIRGIGR